MDRPRARFLTLPADRLSARPETYSFSWPAAPALELLEKSVGRFGLLRPLLAVEGRGEEELVLVAGSRRLEMLLRIGVTDVPVRLLEALAPAELWDLLLEEQLLGGPLNAVEVGLYARKRLATTGETVEELARAVLPRLGLAPKAGALEDAFWAADLPPAFRDRLAQGAFPPQGLRVLVRAPKEDALTLLDLLAGVTPGVNRFLELARWIFECAWAEGLTAREWIARQGLRPPGTQAELEDLRREVRRRRLPTVCRWEESFDRDVDSLRLRERIRISHPPGFEGRLACTLSFASLEELRAAAEELLGAVDSGRLSPLAKYLE
ncbi:MAG: ParB N-terminal domain-containing protein [Deltaproteobacteria bacterium]|nr:ParB N-terminal domain-containing protein [Deltaproteobacteria bacterium]